MRTLSRGTTPVFFALLALSAGTMDLAAQEQETPQTCTATAMPAGIDAATAATSLSLTLSEAIGAVQEFRPAEDSGLTIAAPEDLPKVDMAQEEGEARRPIEMANEGNAVTIWLNSEDASEGTHEFTLVGTEGECTGSVVVRPTG